MRGFNETVYAAAKRYFDDNGGTLPVQLNEAVYKSLKSYLLSNAQLVNDWQHLNELIIQAAEYYIEHGGGVPTEYPYSVTQKAWGPSVWNLRLSGTTGPTVPPTKTIGVDTLPAGATIVGTVVTLGGAGGTFSGWDVTGHQINVTAPGWTLENNKFRATSGATYSISNTAADTIVRRNDFDGTYGAGNIGLFTSGARARISYNHAWGYSSDWIKGEGGNFGADQPIVEFNFIQVGGWSSPTAHSDSISFSAGEFIVQDNLLDLTGYQDPITGPFGNSIDYFVPPRPINTSPHGYTYGATNAIRMSPSTGPVGTPTIQRNIIIGHMRTGYYPLSTNTGLGVVGLTVDDNIIEEGVSGYVMNPDSVGAITFTNNTRFSDGALYDTKFGGTDVPPSAPVLDSFDTIEDSSVRAIFDRAGDAASHEYAYSSDGGFTWSSWIGFDSSLAVLGGLPSDATLQIRLRGVNVHGNGATSNTLAVTTLPASATSFVRANNQGVAYSRITAPFAGQTSARRLVIAFRIRSNTNFSVARKVFSSTFANNYLIENASSLMFRAVNSGVLSISSTKRPDTGVWETHVFTIDCTVAGTDTTGTVGDVCKHYVLTEAGVFLSSALGDIALTGTAHTSAGARVLGLSALYANLDILSEAGVDSFNAGIEWFGIKHGDNTMTLPAFANGAAMEAMFGDASVATTLAGFQIGVASQSAFGVGASDGSDANTWNATTGLNNIGTNAGKNAVKQTGTYTG